ncbi:hypothetical protein Sru01_45570 [Sphaerisporangium rufum]|uniref:DUF5666 domain-containing protein n=1 Tax=Sphaerisporangium rufum TaxID=1381558 RepID=A0A919V6P7_9ACTN|nr:hypothetical protein [Sphaerisporangium rufum]GII79575.1 hypothetical protein Sru01_45570 [Sphaerisporangium rufum]
MSTSRRKPEPAPAAEPLETSPFDGDLDAELTPRPAGRRMSTLTLVLGAGVLLVAGMVAGIQAHKWWGASTGVDALIAAAQRSGAGQGAGRPAGAGRFPGQGQGGQAGQGGLGQGGAGQVTFGTVKLVDGAKIYLQTASGEIVTVRTTGDTRVQVTRAGKVKDLKPGSTVVVQGERRDDGTVGATAVSQAGAPGGRTGGG